MAEAHAIAIYGYIRVSDETQAMSGLGLAAQSRRIAEAAQRICGGKLNRILADKAVSARRKPLLERTQGAELDRLLSKGDHVIIAKLDRAFRNLRDFAGVMDAWRNRGVYVHLLDLGVDTNTPVGELVAGIMAAVAQWESQRIGERIKEAKAILRSRGRTTNGRPLIGTKIRRKLVIPDPAQRKVMRLIARLREKERLSWPEIAAELKRQKLRTGEGRPWSKQAAWRAYRRDRDLQGKHRIGQRVRQ